MACKPQQAPNDSFNGAFRLCDNYVHAKQISEIITHSISTCVHHDFKIKFFIMTAVLKLFVVNKYHETRTQVENLNARINTQITPCTSK